MTIIPGANQAPSSGKGLACVRSRAILPVRSLIANVPVGDIVRRPKSM